jgi:hypothetical protein
MGTDVDVDVNARVNIYVNEGQWFTVTFNLQSLFSTITCKRWFAAAWCEEGEAPRPQLLRFALKHPLSRVILTGRQREVIECLHIQAKLPQASPRVHNTNGLRQGM